MYSKEKNIYNYLNPFENTNLSSLSESELKEVLQNINKYYLEYRTIVGLDKDITFGFEIESEYAFFDYFSDLNVDGDWDKCFDGSLFEGIELVSPSFTDNIDTWKDVREKCKLVRSFSRIGLNAAAHIHIGAHTLGDNPKYWMNFIKLWSTYEDIIFRFLYGEYLNYRVCINNYAQNLKFEFNNIYNYLSSKPNLDTEFILEQLPQGKKTAVTFKNVYNFNEIQKKNTIEFRCPNGTLEEIIWQNNQNLLGKIIMYSRSKKFNDKIVNERFISDDKYATLESYEEINIEKAIEFADLIFDNNVDKIYFLRQYLKNNQVSEQPNKKGKKFIRKPLLRF